MDQQHDLRTTSWPISILSARLRVPYVAPSQEQMFEPLCSPTGILLSAARLAMEGSTARFRFDKALPNTPGCAARTPHTGRQPRVSKVLIFLPAGCPRLVVRSVSFRPNAKISIPSFHCCPMLCNEIFVSDYRYLCSYMDAHCHPFCTCMTDLRFYTLL